MNYVIDAARCVACLACVRVCPTDAIAVAGDPPLLQVVDEACVRCGQCLPACPHDAVDVSGQLGRALAIAAEGRGILILAPESAAHFYPAAPEQVVNACYAAGFRVVTRGIIGDELVAGEYLRLWEEESWGTMLRSTDPVIVETVKVQYPELVPFLAPVTTPAVAEARHLRAKYGRDVPVVHAGVALPKSPGELDAVITFEDLEQVFRVRGVHVLAQAVHFSRVPEERRRHLSAAGGMPLAMLEQARQSSRRFRTLRGVGHLAMLARAIADDRLDLGFVDILSTDGPADHPLLGPRDRLFWRRQVLASVEPPRSQLPVVEQHVIANVGATFDLRPRRQAPEPEAVQAVLEAIGSGPNGRPWDCGACGYPTCRRFAESAAAGRTTLRLCPPYLQRRAEDAEAEAAIDTLTGLATFRVLQDRLAFEIERSKRNQERFAVLFLDLDNFKQVNDRFGHEVGNEILREVAGVIREAVRASDVAARYGGDEFVVILTRTDLPGAERVAEALRVAIEAVGGKLGYPAGTVSVSIGLAEFDPRQPVERDLLVSADRALYKAKAMGRNAVA
jgi:diguanylate cyclase (GGDEF)-like protein